MLQTFDNEMAASSAFGVHLAMTFPDDLLRSKNVIANAGAGVWQSRSWQVERSKTFYVKNSIQPGAEAGFVGRGNERQAADGAFHSQHQHLG
jgi:hypothetical protein